MALLATIVAPALLFWSWSRPRAAAPSEMPTLALPPDAVRAQLEADVAAAAGAPDDEAARTRRALYDETNQAELEAADPPGRARRRAERLAAALTALGEAHGDDAVAATRAADLARAEAAMRGALPEVQRASAVGAFGELLERWNMARRGRQVAPRFVMRTAFKARWNAMHGLEPTASMSEVEQRAHWGWLALHGDAATLEMRLDAAERYAELGGERADEARAVLLFDEGAGGPAQEAFEAAYADTPSFRLRNHALAALIR